MKKVYTVLAFFLLFLSATAADFESPFGSTRTYTVNVESGKQYSFKVTNVPKNYPVEWYFNNTYVETKYTDIFGTSPSFNATFNNSGTGKIIIYNSSWQQLESHTWTCTVSKPDIIVESMRYVPSNPQKGETVTLYATIKNIGTAGAELINWTYYINGNAVGTDSYNWNLVDRLTQGEVREESCSYTFSSGGSFTYSVTVTSCTPSESSTSNNNRTTVIVVNTPPTIPVTPLPANGSINVSRSTASIDWANSTDANGDAILYEVYFGTDATPDAGELLGTVSSSVYPLPALDYDKTYYWKIIAKDNRGGITEGPVWNFKTEVARPDIIVENLRFEPAVPQKGEPVTLFATIKNIGPGGAELINWTYYINGSSVGTDSYNWNLVDRLTQGEVREESCSYTFTSGGSFTYSVTVTSCTPSESSTSNNNRTTVIVVNTPPTIPVTPLPANGSINVSRSTASIDWANSTDANGDAILYEVYFGTDATPDAGELLGTVSSSVYPLPALDYDKTYYWKIIAKDNRGGITEGPVWNFKTEVARPDIIVENLRFEPAVPQKGEPVTLFATIKNIGPGGAELINWTYYINGSSVGTDSYNWNLVDRLTQGEVREESCSYTFTSGGSFTYSVIITTCDPTESITNNNTNSTIININVPPTVPAYLSPGQNETGIPTSSTLKWTLSTDLNDDLIQYKVYLGTDETPDDGGILNESELKTTTLGSSYDFTELENDKVYYWKIVAIDGKGGLTEGPIWSFRTTPPTFALTFDIIDNAISRHFAGNIRLKVYESPTNYNTLLYDQISQPGVSLSWFTAPTGIHPYEIINQLPEEYWGPGSINVTKPDVFEIYRSAPYEKGLHLAYPTLSDAQNGSNNYFSVTNTAIAGSKIFVPVNVYNNESFSVQVRVALYINSTKTYAAPLEYIYGTISEKSSRTVVFEYIIPSGLSDNTILYCEPVIEANYNNHFLVTDAQNGWESFAIVNNAPTRLVSANDDGSGILNMEYSGHQGTLVRFGSKLFSTLNDQLVPLSLKDLHFEIQSQSGQWSVIEEDGITTTSQYTNNSGLAENYFIIPDDLAAGTYNIKAVFNGDPVYSGTSKSGILTVSKPGHNLYQVRSHDPITGPGIPLILIHGNGADRSDELPWSRWDTFMNFVDANPLLFKEFDLYIWFHTTEIPIGFNGYTGNAKYLANAISSLGGKKVILVAHSQGGLIARSYMNYNNQGENVLGLITLGTPHHGSPFAVPDWNAWTWGRNVNGSTGLFDNIESLAMFNIAVNYEPTSLLFLNLSPAFDYDKIGSLNLAWDNEDQVMDSYFSFDWPGVSFSINGKLQFSSRDLNSSNNYADMDLLYSDLIKSKFGTLQYLNNLSSNLINNSKTICYGAYDQNISLLSNGSLSTEELTINQVAKNEHGSLAWLTKLLSFAHDGITNETNYLANDGMVPLQSALLLNISGGGQFASKNVLGEINIDEDLINSRQLVKHMRIFNGSTGLKDHLDLLDASITNQETQYYWNTLAMDIRSFMPSSGYNLSGSLIYGNANLTPLNSNSIALLNSGGAILANSVTNTTGGFSFSGLTDGSYSLRPTISKPWSGSTAMDITSYKKHIGALTTLNPLQIKSGDVNGSNSLTTMDLTIIKQRIGSQISSFPVGDWVYESPTITINGADKLQNIVALCYGDANGSYIPAQKSVNEIFIPGDESIKLLSDMEFEVPVRIGTNINNLSSITLKFNYPSDLLTIKDIKMTLNDEDMDFYLNDSSVTLIYSSINPVNLQKGDQIMTLSFAFKEIPDDVFLNTFKLNLSGSAEFGDFDDKVIDGVELIYASGNISSDISSNQIDNVIVYPNPAGDHVTLLNVENTTIDIYTITGVICLTNKCYSSQTEINLKNLKSGSYIVKIQKSNGLIINKLLIIK